MTGDELLEKIARVEARDVTLTAGEICDALKELCEPVTVRRLDEIRLIEGIINVIANAAIRKVKP